jgi:hypothetical protein
VANPAKMMPSPAMSSSSPPSTLPKNDTLQSLKQILQF